MDAQLRKKCARVKHLNLPDYSNDEDEEPETDGDEEPEIDEDDEF